MTGVVEIFVGLLLAVAVLALLARKLHIPYPILFVIGGLLLGLIPKLPKVPLRIVTILEGESLVNDATALVAYRFAVVAVTTGSFSLARAGGQFFIVGIGGILIGLAVGWLAERFHKRVDDAPIEITVSLLPPFAAYFPAERLGGSRVLAVVTAGLDHPPACEIFPDRKSTRLNS